MPTALVIKIYLHYNQLVYTYYNIDTDDKLI